jgi:hypothetical protein
MFRDRLIANLKVMMEEYAQRDVISMSIYNVTINQYDNSVKISYVLTCYEQLENSMDKHKYDDYRNKLLHYCIRTAEMLTSSKEVSKVYIEERMIMDSYEVEYVTKRLEIY